MEVDDKKCIIHEHLSVMAPVVIGKTMYSQELIVREFQCFAISRSFYNQLRIDYQLPSIKIITRITSKLSTLNKAGFMCDNFINDASSFF